MNETERLKEIVQKEVDSIKDRLIEMSDWIYENPEYGCEEFKASKLLSDELRKHGFEVEKPFLDMPTAFKGTFRGKEGGRRVAILGEYDALEGIGHGCGHNIIGTSAVGAGIALSKMMKEIPGEVLVFGCPAEEGRKGGPPGGWPCQGSKRLMSAQGAFDDVDASIMIHPTSGITRVGTSSLISRSMDVIFKGKSAHAAADPWDGRNAMQSAVLFMNGINALRQQFRRGKPYIPVSHWIILEAGTASNVIPDMAHCYGSCRSQDKEYLNELLKLVHQCAKGAAMMMGCELDFRPRPVPGPPRGEEPEVKTPNLYLTNLLYDNLLKLGIETEDWRLTARMQPGGGTDFSNVTIKVPGVDISISLSKERIQGHSTAFAKATTGKGGHLALINGTKALAMTAIDIFTKPEHAQQMKATHLMDLDEYTIYMQEQDR
jgi:amidohydrolase